MVIGRETNVRFSKVSVFCTMEKTRRADYSIILKVRNKGSRPGCPGARIFLEFYWAGVSHMMSLRILSGSGGSGERRGGSGGQRSA